MPDQRPNILLLMTDQHRGDCLGIDGHPVLQTPVLDEIAASGVHFRRAYSECPVCIPARRSLMTGQRPSSHGVFMNYNTRLDGPTLPGELSKAGYQTHLVGKLHLWPYRKLYGFDSAQWADAPHGYKGIDDDYQRFLRREGLWWPDAAIANGANGNGWNVRPYDLDERFHFSHWCADNALDFLERRDPTVPFFLKVSFLHPHQPLTPPAAYYDRYLNMDLPEPPVADWARIYDEPVRGLPVAAWRASLEPTLMHQYRAAYYGCINHIDDQISRIMYALRSARNTIVIFCADHGEMLCDHQWIRKRSAFEGSARIPMIMRFPEHMGLKQHQVLDEPVQLMDVMPTLLEAAGVPIPDTVDGMSVLPWLRGEANSRPYVHGECAEIPTANTGQQYLTDGRFKYIWHPGTGDEYYFDLENDPREMRNLATEPRYGSDIADWRRLLIDELRDRPEGFTDGESLLPLSSPTPFCLPGYEADRTMTRGAGNL